MEVKKIIEKKNARVESESHASGVFFIIRTAPPTIDRV